MRGFLADRFGRKRMLCTGYALFAIGALACTLAPNGGSLIAFRVLQAVGGTALTPTSLSIVANLYPDPRERARAIGLWGISSGLGTGLGPIVGGSLTEWLGWRSVFAANAIAGVVALVDRPSRRAALAQRGRAAHRRGRAAARHGLPGDPDLRADRGAALRLRLAAHRRRMRARGACCSSAFIVVELRVDEPLIDLGFFRDRQFAGAVFLCAATFFTFGGFIYFNALYLQDVRGYSALAAGLLTLPGGHARADRRPALGLPRRHARAARRARRRHARPRRGRRLARAAGRERALWAGCSRRTSWSASATPC